MPANRSLDSLLPSLRAMSASERKVALASIEERDPDLHDQLLDALWGQTVTVALDSRSADLRAGDLLGGKYQIVAPLGDGASGSVYRALDVGHVGDREFEKREVALKVSRVDTGHDALNRDLLQKEARLLRRLRHPRLPHVEALFEDGGRWVVVMEYIAGDSLKDRQKTRSTPFPVEQVTAWVRDALRVLDYLHTLHTRPSKKDGAVVTDEPIYHRDIKPANLVLDAHDNLYVVDLGIARSGISELTEIAPSLVGRGSAGYAPPEIGRGEETTAQSDLYSLGMTAFSLLTSEPARDYSARRRMEERGVSGIDPFDTALDRADLPNHTRAWIRTSTALIPADRYPSAAAMTTALTARPVASSTAPPAPRSRTSLVVAVTALVCVVLVAVGWPLVQSQLSEPRQPTDAESAASRLKTEASPADARTGTDPEPTTTESSAPAVELATPAAPPPAQRTAPPPALTTPPPAPQPTAPAPVPGGSIQATVLGDDGSPLAGTTVTLVETGAQTTADAQGGVRFADVPPGTYQLRVDAEGYVARDFRAVVEAGGVLTRTLQFEIEDLELSAY